MKTTINKTHRVARFTLFAVLTILVGSSARAHENVEDIIVTNVEGAAAEWTFTMPNYSVTAEVEYLDLYSLSGKNVFFCPENSIGHITEAVEGQKVTVGFDYDASIGNYYFTGNYTSDDVTITVDEVGNGTFTMPAKAVTVTPVLAPQEEYIINLVTATKQTIPKTMWMLLFGLEQYYDYDDNTKSFLFDLNLDGKNDMQMKVVDNEETGVSVYSVTRLEGADDITSETDLRRPLSYIHNLQYNSVLFLFNAKDIKDAVVTLEKTEYPYDGAEHKPAVTVTLGTTQLTADQDFTISYPADCTSPGTKTITVSGKGMYCGTATKTYEIDGSAIDDVIGLINAIGTVEYTDASKAKIDAARTACDALNEAQQKLVTNYTTLTTAETTYANLKAAAEQAAAEQAAKQEAFKNGIKAEDYTGTYDGLAHSITVKAPEGATVKYGTEVDKYGTDNPSFKDANTYTVYYEVSSAGLTPVKGSAEVKISRKALTLIADPVEIFEGEDLPTAFMGKITGFVEGEGLTDTDVLTFSLDNPNASVAGDYSITGMLTIPNKEAAKSGDYGTNYTFSNAAENATALTIKKQVQKKTIEASWITVDVGDGLTYNGDFQKPAVTVTDGETTLSAETDYNVTYSNNKNACEATAENAPTVTVTAKETSTNYTSSASMNFTIGKVTVTASGFTVKDKEKDGDDQMAELITTGVKLDGVITGSGDNQGDQVGIKGVTGIFEDADIGEDKIVNLDYTNASLTGKDAGNYTLDKANSQQMAIGKILTEITVDGDGNVIEFTKIVIKDADGTIIGVIETTKTTKKAADGSATGTINETAKNGNENVFVTSEGEIKVVVANGKTTETTIRTDKDAAGNIIQTTETVKTTEKDADGNITVTIKEELTEANGQKIRYTETVKKTVKDADGNTTETINEIVSEPYLNPIRTIKTKKEIVKTPDGQKTETINETVTEANGNITTTTIETKTDGSLQETKTVTHADNSVTETVKETVKNADGSKSITIINTEKDAGGETTETKEIHQKIVNVNSNTETVEETIKAADGTTSTTTSTITKTTEWDGYDPTKHPLSEKTLKTVKNADESEIGSSQTVKRLYLDVHFNVYYTIETIEEKWKYPDGSSIETKEVTETNAIGVVIKHSKTQIMKDALGNQVKKSEESLENGSQVDISGVSNTQLAIPEGIAGRVSLVSEGTSENMRQSIIVSKGKAVQMALPNAKKGGKFQINYASEVSKAKFRKNAMAFRGDKPGMRNSRTRGAEDEMIEIVSGEEYLVLQDGPLVLTFDVEEGPISIESITLTDPDPNDLDGSGKVDAVDLVKAIGAGKTQAEIDAIVNAIMQK